SGDTMPVPVITTRLIARSPPHSCSRCHQKTVRPAGRGPRQHRRPKPPCRYICARSGLSLLAELYSVADRQDRVSGIVRDFDAELFFEGHDQFDSVERVRTQIVDEAGAFNNLFSVNAEMINNNFLHAFCDIAHVGFLDLLNLRGVWTTSLPCFKPVNI